jgi:hypothetical protein
VSLGPGTTLEAGTRLTFVPARQTVYAEPRLAVRHDGRTGREGTYAVRVASGLYRTFVQQFTLSTGGPSASLPATRLWLPIDATLAPPRAYHLTAEALLAPSPAWQVNVEAYLKEQPRILAIDYAALLRTPEALPLSLAPREVTQSAFVAPSRGRALGAGLRLRHRRGRLDAEASYAWSWARRTFPGRFDDRSQPTPWNEPHRLTLAARLDLTDPPRPAASADGRDEGLAATARWRGVWGRAWGFRDAYYDLLTTHDALTSTPPYDLSDPGAHVLPPLYRLDLGLAYARTVGGVTLRAEATVFNVLDRANVFDWSLAPAPEASATEDFVPAPGQAFGSLPRTLPGRRPILTLGVRY